MFRRSSLPQDGNKEISKEPHSRSEGEEAAKDSRGRECIEESIEHTDTSGGEENQQQHKNIDLRENEGEECHQEGSQEERHSSDTDEAHHQEKEKGRKKKKKKKKKQHGKDVETESEEGKTGGAKRRMSKHMTKLAKDVQHSRKDLFKRFPNYEFLASSGYNFASDSDLEAFQTHPKWINSFKQEVEGCCVNLAHWKDEVALKSDRITYRAVDGEWGREWDLCVRAAMSTKDDLQAHIDREMAGMEDEFKKLNKRAEACFSTNKALSDKAMSVFKNLSVLHDFDLQEKKEKTIAHEREKAQERRKTMLLHKLHGIDADGADGADGQDSRPPSAQDAQTSKPSSSLSSSSSTSPSAQVATTNQAMKDKEEEEARSRRLAEAPNKQGRVQSVLTPVLMLFIVVVVLYILNTL